MFQPVNYSDLNARQKENFNFQKIAGKLADYGYNCIKLSDDWQGADFIAYHVNGDEFLKVQLKARMTVDNKYFGKNIYIAFIHDDRGFVFPHDEVLEKILKESKVGQSESWLQGKAYSWPTVPKWILKIIKEYEV